MAMCVVACFWFSNLLTSVVNQLQTPFRTGRRRKTRARKAETAGEGIPSQIWTSYICRV